MTVVILAGDFGAGKTTFIKDKLSRMNKKKNKMLFALVKNDYGFDIIRDQKIFFADAVNAKDTLMVLDEAAIALPQKMKSSPDEHQLRILKTFINARKLNNFIFIVFHSLGEIPLWLVKYCDMLIRFRTNDLMQYQLNRFSSFAPIVESINNYPSMDNFEHDPITIRK